MSDEIEVKVKNEKEDNLPVKKKKEVPEHIKRKRRRHRRWKNFIFGFVWTYSFVSIFIANIDSLIISKIEIISLSLYSSLRLIIILLAIFTTWIYIGNKRFWKNIGLFFLFPIYPGLWLAIRFFFWKTPRFLIKQKLIILLYYYVEYVIKFFVDFKYVILKITLFICGFILMYRLHSYWLFIPLVIFFFLQFNHLYLRFKQTFSPIKIFKISVDDLNDIANTPFTPEKIGDAISDSQSKDEKTDEEKLLKEMELFIILNEFTKNLNLKLKEIINRRVYMLSFLGKTFYSFFISMVYFGAINYCVYLINNSHFSLTFTANYFDFFYYSFFTIIPDGSDIEAMSVLSKIIRMTGVLVGVFINLLLLTVYLTISNERFKENLERLLNFTDNYSKGINIYFEKKYGKNPTEGLKKLRSIGSSIDNTMLLIKTFMKLK